MRDPRVAAIDRAPLRDASSRSAARSSTSIDFASLYDGWFDHVARWLRAHGAPPSDLEDLAQEVFLVVRRRLGEFDGRNLAGWLHRIASRQVAQHRRRRWLRRVLSPRPTIDIEDLPAASAGALAVLETKEKRILLERILGRMSDKRRTVFALFEVEGYGGEEIADILDVPVNTVWTRLHYARKDFFALLAQHERSQKGGG